MESIQKDDLTIASGCLCCYSLCYWTLPDCIGCAYERECICIGEKGCCKAGAVPYWCVGDENTCCQLGCGICAIFLKSPTTCCKQEAQCCCCIQNCSFPNEESMPCILSAYFLTCYPTCGCCVKYDAVSPKK